MAAQYPDKIGGLLLKTRDNLALMNMIFADGYKGDVDESSLLQSLLNKANLNIKSLSHELALKATEEYCSQAEFADDILKLNDRCLLEQRSKVSFERTENKEIYMNTKENGQVDAIDLYPLKHLSPGEKFKLENALKILSDPSHPFNRQTVQNAYGIQLPTILQTRVTEEQQRQNKKMQESKSQSNVALTTVRKKKKDLKLIQYDETSDNNCNALNLIQRGLIPSNAQITFDPSPMQTKSMHLISPNTKLPHQPITINDLCPVYEPINIHEVPKPITLKKKSRSVLSDSKSVAVRDVSKADRNTESVFITENPTLSRRQASSKATPPPCTPITTCSSHGNFWLTTEEGLFQTQSEDYQAFEAQFTDNWDKISILLCELENLFDFYGISVAVVNGIKLAKLAKDYENNLGSLTSDILLTSIEDSQTIRRIMTEPGSSFRGRQGPTRAAIKIQSTFRRYRAQKQYDEQKRLRGAAAIISTSWIRYKKMKQLRERLSNTRKYCTEISQKKLKELGNNWERFEQNSHVVVHLPSASYSESIRQQLGSIEELEYMESRQIARICEIRNPNRDVVIVTRAPISDDLLEYYNKLLGLTTAIETGQAENQCSISSRYRIIVPEAIKYFHSNAASPMCLASLLKYSPRALKHIRRFIAGRPAILIPGFGEHDDIFYVANCLEIPVWSSTPSINSLFTLQSTTRRLVKQLLDTLSDRDISTDLKNQNISKASALFTSVITSRRKVIDDTRTNKLLEGFGKLKKDIDKFVTGQNYWPVEQPPGDFDIYTMDHLCETLASLFTENLPIKNWLLKIDHNNIDKHATAFISIENLQSFKWALEQRQWHGAARWNKKWAQETTYVKILSEVPQLLQRHLKLFPNSFYTDSTSFIEAFLKHGGVIEACPPIDEWTNLSVVIAILPNKTVRIVASGDQIHSEDKFYTWGETIPMSSVTPLWVNNLSMGLGSLMANKGVVGYVNIDFLTFIHPEKNEQILWITDIKPGYTDLLAMTQLVLFATNTTFKINQSTGEHEIIAKPPTILLEKMIVKSQETIISNEIQENKFKRYAIVSTRLHHSNLTMIQYSVFFKICRANYIGYNLKDRQGILFSPMDSYRRDRLALVSISESLEEALRKFGSTLKILHKEVSTPNMTGISNFQSVIKEVEQILGQVIENSLEQNMLTTMKEKEIHMNQSIKSTQQNKKIMKK
ncbi:unnamed protein product [Schistosoma mattheei]|uniref:IQCH-like ATP-grasp domain-containing protein n=1 Tax=Schistosoma mattheei TaxID=31246 RepID=A0AA85AU48_9TREM|nr:unnamed protein product [Schistosoma mattheei]